MLVNALIVFYDQLRMKAAALSSTATASESALWEGAVARPENQLALQAIQRLARAVLRGAVTPTLTIHGPTGVGKSLLAAGLVRRIIRGPQVRTVQSLPARELAFDSEFADLIGVDLLIVEDLQLLPANAAPMMSRLLDDRVRRRRATFVTANAAPAKLTKLPRRLLGRLAGGLVIGIDAYSAASRKAILRHHLEAKKLSLEPAALDWLAARPTGGSLRPLLGILDALKSQHRGQATPITRDAVQRLRDDEPLNVERIVARVAATFGVKAKELLGPSRLRNVLLPRQVAMFLARDLAALSLPRIGAHFGGRDHSTVLHAVNKIRTALVDDRALAGTVRQLKLELA